MYLGGLAFKNGLAESYNFADGRLLFKGEEVRFQYSIKDHLGNSVVPFEDKNTDGLLTTEATSTNPDDLEVLQRNFYYAFGMSMEGEWQAVAATPENRYLYNGKEELEGVGLYDYGARYYDPAIARWTGVDALADHPNQVDKSVYAYAWNNPVSLTDPDGNCPSCLIGGIISAAVDLGSQVLVNKLQGKGAFDNINYSSVGIAFAGGFVSGGISTLKNVGTLGKALLGTSIDVAESVTNQAIEGDVSLTKTLTDVAASTASGLIKVDGINTKPLEKKSDRLTRIALGSTKSSKVKNAVAAESALKKANNYNTGINKAAQKSVENGLQKGADGLNSYIMRNSIPVTNARESTSVQIILPQLSLKKD